MVSAGEMVAAGEMVVVEEAMEAEAVRELDGAERDVRVEVKNVGSCSGIGVGCREFMFLP